MFSCFRLVSVRDSSGLRLLRSVSFVNAGRKEMRRLESTSSHTTFSLNLVVSTTPTPSRRNNAGVVQNRKDLLRAYPTFYINFLVGNSPRGFDQLRVLTAACAEFTFSVRRNFHSDHGCPEVRHIAEEFDRTLTIPVFHFTICRTHSAERLNATLDALRYSCPLSGAKLKKRLLPHRLKSCLLDSESFLLRNHTNTHFAIGIHRETVHSSTTEIHGIVLRQVRWIFQITLNQPAIFSGALRGSHVQRNHFFWREAHG